MIVLCIERRHIICFFRLAGIDDLNTVDMPWEQTDVVDVIFFAIRVRLNDKRSLIHHQLQLLGFPQLHDFRMLLKPALVKPVNEKIRAFIG